MGIVDIDAHYMEEVEGLTEYLDFDDPWRERFESSGDRIFPSSTGSRGVYGRIDREQSSYPEPMTPEEIPEAMEFVDADQIVMITHRLLAYGKMDGDDERAPKFANMYVDYMLDEVVDPDEGIHTIIPAPYESPYETVELIDRVGDEEGIVGLCMLTGRAEPPLGHRKYDEIYEACERHDLPVVFHTSVSGLDAFHLKGYEKFIETHSLGFLMNNAAQLTSVIIGGVPEKFPDLDLVFVESGLTYVPMLMTRLDSEYMKRPSEVPILEQPPSEYMKSVYYGTQPLEITDQDYLETVVDMIGPEQLMWASDYPHWDFDPPSVIEELPFLSRSEKEAILGGNAEEVFGI